MMPLSNKRYAEMSGKMAPLSSFAAKIEMALTLGVISEDFYYQLHALRKVRNAFAHQIEALTFDHPEIRKAMRVAHSRLPVRMSDLKSDFLLRFAGSVPHAYMHSGRRYSNQAAVRNACERV
jgi:DNA-binding MltR family transcriptional regulator